MGLWKGKKGSSVFYRIKNSNNGQKQGIRERVYEPANPRTVQQAGQRMKMLPAQRVYGALKDIIERAWQGKPYDGSARQEFLKIALSSSTTVWPALEKNDPNTPPGAYQISKGTLNQVTCIYNEEIGDFVTSIYDDGQIENTSTIGEATEVLLAQNSWLQEGDQITFVCCNSDANGDGIYWQNVSLNLDTTNTDTWASTLGLGYGVSIEGSVDAGEPNGLHFTTAGILSAAAVIVSRDAPTPLRSTAVLAVNTAGLDDYYSTTARARARASYMNPERRSERDWEVQPTDGGSGTEATSYTVSGLTGAQLAIFNGADVLVYADTTTGELVGVGVRTGSGWNGTTVVEGPCCCNADGTLLTRDYTAGGEVLERNLLVAQVTDLADLRQISQG